MSKIKKILILYCKAGGGHESAAKAIKNRFSEKYPDQVDFLLVDIYAGSSSFIQWLNSDFYGVLIDKLSFIWNTLSFLWRYRWFGNLSEKLARGKVYKYVQKMIQEYQPDMIISTYFFCDVWARQSLAELGEPEVQSLNEQKEKSSIQRSDQAATGDLDEKPQVHGKDWNKVITYNLVTELFLAPNIWFFWGGNFLTFSDRASAIAKQKAVSDKALKIKTKSGKKLDYVFSISQFGPFFDQKFNTRPILADLDRAKEQLYIHSKIGQPQQNQNQTKIQDQIKTKQDQSKNLMLIGGGSGIPGGMKILKELLKVSKINLFVVCGRDKSGYDQILKYLSKSGFEKKDPETLNKTFDSNSSDKEKEMFLDTNFVLFTNKETEQNIWVWGFCKSIKTVINLSDLVISKSGPALMMEVLSQKKPLLLSHYIWEHEKGNMEFVVENRFGEYIPSSKKIAQRVASITQSEIHQYILNIQNAIEAGVIRSDMDNLIDFLNTKIDSL